MAAIMTVGSLTACGGDTADTSSTPADTSSSSTTETVAEPTKAPELDTTVEAADISEEVEGKVLNIYCWNEEFKSRLTDHYPGYEVVDATTGKIGDIEVRWNITPSDDNAYQNNLDDTLKKQDGAADDDKIDLFLVEADYALKYVDTAYTLPVTDLGIDLSELSTQYKYTQDVMLVKITPHSARSSLEPKGLPSLVVLIHHQDIFNFQNSRRWIRTTVGRARIFSPATRRSGISMYVYNYHCPHDGCFGKTHPPSC